MDPSGAGSAWPGVLGPPGRTSAVSGWFFVRSVFGDALVSSESLFAFGFPTGRRGLPSVFVFLAGGVSSLASAFLFAGVTTGATSSSSSLSSSGSALSFATPAFFAFAGAGVVSVSSSESSSSSSSLAAALALAAGLASALTAGAALALAAGLAAALTAAVVLARVFLGVGASSLDSSSSSSSDSSALVV